MTPAERAKAECRNSPAVSEARIAHALSGREKLFEDLEEDAVEACMALRDISDHERLPLRTEPAGGRPLGCATLRAGPSLASPRRRCTQRANTARTRGLRPLWRSGQTGKPMSRASLSIPSLLVIFALFVPVILTTAAAAASVTYRIYFHGGKVLEVDEVERSDGPDLPYRRGEVHGSVPKAEVQRILRVTRPCDRPTVGDRVGLVRGWVQCIRGASMMYKLEGQRTTITFQDSQSGETFRVTSVDGVISEWEGTPGSPPPAPAPGPPQRIYLKDGTHIDADKIEFVGQGQYVRWVYYWIGERQDRVSSGAVARIVDRPATADRCEALRPLAGRPDRVEEWAKCRGGANPSRGRSDRAGREGVHLDRP
jgi:hypothetical protein